MERGWRRGYTRVQLVIPFHLDLAVASYGWSGSAPIGGVEADVLLVDSTALEVEVRERSANWAGKILLLTPKDPKHFDLFRFGKWTLQRRETARGFARRHDIACPYVGRIIWGKAVGLSGAPSAMGERLKNAWQAWINLLD